MEENSFNVIVPNLQGVAKPILTLHLIKWNKRFYIFYSSGMYVSCNSYVIRYLSPLYDIGVELKVLT